MRYKLGARANAKRLVPEASTAHDHSTTYLQHHWYGHWKTGNKQAAHRPQHVHGKAVDPMDMSTRTAAAVSVALRVLSN